MTKSAMANRSSREAWLATRARASRFGEASVFDQSANGDLGIDVDDDYRVQSA
jgi:hypothetical protein